MKNVSFHSNDIPDRPPSPQEPGPPLPGSAAESEQDSWTAGSAAAPLRAGPALLLMALCLLPHRLLAPQ